MSAVTSVKVNRPISYKTSTASGILNSLYSTQACDCTRQDAALSQGGPRDAAANFDMYRSLQRHRAVFTTIATLSN